MTERVYTPAELRTNDLTVPCIRCGAEVGEDCKGMDTDTATGEKLRHFCRRLRWMVERHRPDLLEPPS